MGEVLYQQVHQMYYVSMKINIICFWKKKQLKKERNINNQLKMEKQNLINFMLKENKKSQKLKKKIEHDKQAWSNVAQLINWEGQADTSTERLRNILMDMK